MLAKVRENISLFLLYALSSMGYAHMRLIFNQQYNAARWQPLLDMQASRPFVTRLLIPRLCHYWQVVFGTDVATMFWVVESFATFALLLGTAFALSVFISRRASYLAGFVLLWGLTFPFLCKHYWSVYFPYDT